MRILICGGRDYEDEERVSFFLREYLRDGDTVITGGATGADRLAHEIARRNGFKTEVYPADWDKYGRKAGPIRNRQMLSTGVDLVVAFPGGRGTSHMIRIAKEAEVTVYEIPLQD